MSPQPEGNTLTLVFVMRAGNLEAVVRHVWMSTNVAAPDLTVPMTRLSTVSTTLEAIHVVPVPKVTLGMALPAVMWTSVSLTMEGVPRTASATTLREVVGVDRVQQDTQATA